MELPVLVTHLRTEGLMDANWITRSEMREARIAAARWASEQTPISAERFREAYSRFERASKSPWRKHACRRASLYIRKGGVRR